jgi:hypothetical protein
MGALHQGETLGTRGDVRGLLGGRPMSGSGSELVLMVDCEFRKPEMLRWVGVAGMV